MVVVDNQGLDDNGVLAAVSPVDVLAGRSDEVGSPDYGEVAGGHARGGLVVREVVEVAQEVLESLEVVVRQLEDGFPKQWAVVVDWLAGDIQQPLVQTVGQQGVGQRTEEELNTK